MARGRHSERVKLLAVAAVLLGASPALAASTTGATLRPPLDLEGSNRAAQVAHARTIRPTLASELRAARRIRTSLDGSERAVLGSGAGVRRFVRVTLDDSRSVASFPRLDAFAAGEVLDARSSGPVRSAEPAAARPLRAGLKAPGRGPDAVARPIRVELSADRVALSTPLPARRFRTTLD